MNEQEQWTRFQVPAMALDKAVYLAGHLINARASELSGVSTPRAHLTDDILAFTHAAYTCFKRMLLESGT